jgi:hypothetical protein
MPQEVSMRLRAGGFGLVLVALLAPWLSAGLTQNGGVLERFPVAGDGDLLIVPVTIQGKQYPFCVDTGCTQTAFDTSLIPLLGPRIDNIEVQGPAKTVQIERYTPPKAYLGKLPLPQQEPALVTDLSAFRGVGGHDIRGLLGMDFLRQYVVRIDFDRGMLTFQKSIGREEGAALQLYFDGLKDIPRVDADLGSGQPERFLVDTGYVSEGAGFVQRDLLTR